MKEEIHVEEGASSHFSGVVNQKTEDDIRYEGMEISTKTMKRMIKTTINDKMKPITDYDQEGAFKQTFEGSVLPKNKKREAQKMDNFAK